MRRSLACALLAFALAAAGFVLAARAADTSFALIERGKRLVDAGDCAGCHTVNPDKPFAGGKPIPTPFGVIDAPNITPDRATGIGGWSDEDFYHAMHFGVAPNGQRYYPAFPYPYFTKMPREDLKAVRAYLNTVQPVQNNVQGNHIVWPLRYRVFMRGWDLVFFSPGTFKPDPGKSAEWNRGAYLVEGPGHCGACHTPKNVLGGDESSKTLFGGLTQNWLAPNIADNIVEGIGSWSVDDIAEYLKTGRNKYNSATGPMSEVVEYSTSKLPDSDLRAIAAYLKNIKGGSTPSGTAPANNVVAAGKAIYADSCSGCHQADGKGVARMFPPLAHNSIVQASDPSDVLHVILEGAKTQPTDKAPTPFAMPPYNWKLTDQQIAAVASYVRTAWGNKGSAVGADQVSDMRRKLHQSQAGGS